MRLSTQIICSLLLLTASIQCQNDKNRASYSVHFNHPVSEFDTSIKEAIRTEIEECLSHSNRIKRLTLTKKPSTAVIVGAGTTGIEAIAYATACLPKESTIILFQHLTTSPEDLENLLKNSIPNGKKYNFIISPPWDIGQLDKIEEFLDQHRKDLSKTKLYIHTADRAERFIPEKTPIKDVLSQIVRRASIALISELIDEVSREDNILKIVLSSDCHQNYSDYRIPNLGPYQMGKVFGDNLFRISNQDNPKSVCVLAFLGGMSTRGQFKARVSEYEDLKEIHPLAIALDEEEFIEIYSEKDVHPMDSCGLVFKEIFIAFRDKKLEPGNCYSIYGPSINSKLPIAKGVITQDEPAPYLWPLLEKFE